MRYVQLFLVVGVLYACSTQDGLTGSSQLAVIPPKDFAELCADPNVILCDPLDAGRASGVGVDERTPCATLPELLERKTPCRWKRSWRWAEIGGAVKHKPKYDPSMGSGSGSLKLTFGSQSDSDDGGWVVINFTPDHSVQFGENETFFVRWKQRFSCEVIYADCDPKGPSYKTDYQSYGHAFKTIIVNAGNTPRKNDYVTSCTWQHLVLTEGVLHAVTGYHSCGWYQNWYRDYGANRHTGRSEVDFQPGGDNECRNLHPDGSYVNRRNPNPDCFLYDADQWMTFQMQVSIGTWQPLRSGDGAPTSNIKLWVSDEAGRTVQVFDHNFHNRGPEPETPWRKYGKVWLNNYISKKDPSRVHPEGYTWYDELIVSRAFIGG